jgi:hypothetical protein
MTIIHDATLQPLYICLRSTDYSNLNNPYGSYITFELYRPIVIQNNVDMWLTIESFKFTNSIYNINIYNNIFYYGLASSGYSLISATIARGNYDITSLLTVLNSIGNGFIFTYSDITMKITITNSQEFYIFSNTYNILKTIGFSNNTQQSLANSLTSNQVINLIGPQMLYISIPNLNLNSFSIRNSTFLNKSIISSIPISSIQGDTQIYSSNLRHAINENIITHLEIKITDEDENEVNFNNIPWFLNLSFIFSYKKEYIKPNYLTDVQDNQVGEVDNQVPS